MKKLVITSLSLALAATTLTPFGAAASGFDTNEEAQSTYETKEVTKTADETNSFNSLTGTAINQNGVINIPTAKTGGPTTYAVTNPGGGGDSTWTYGGTSYYDHKLVYTTLASAASAIGLTMGIPLLGLSGIVGNWMIANKGSWVYMRDIKQFRMAGSTLQVQHNVSYYKDSSLRYQIGGTSTYITNDEG
ncbi:hypothetical protein [Bacillus sp. AK031]